MTPTDRTAQIAAIQERHAKATPGEWKAEPLAGRGGWIGVGLNYTAPSCGNTDQEAQRNAHFIAHAHQDIPFLLSDNARLEAELAASEARVREARKVALEAARSHAEHRAKILEDEDKPLAAREVWEVERRIRNLAQEGETK